MVKIKQTAHRKLFCGTYNVELLQALLASLALYYPEVCAYAADSASADTELDYVRLWVVTRNPQPTHLDLRALAAAQAYAWGFTDGACM